MSQRPLRNYLASVRRSFSWVRRIGVNNGHGGALISAQAAQRMTCDCEIHRVLISSDGLPLDVGRAMRTFPPHIRRHSSCATGVASSALR